LALLLPVTSPKAPMGAFDECFRLARRTCSASSP
jgi:hypothetical protein